MTVGEFCNREVVIANKEDSIVQVAKLMRQHHVGDVVVIDRKDDIKHPIGIFTDRDMVVELVAQEVDLASLAVGDAMSHELITAKESDGIWQTLLKMRSKGVRRLPVVNDQGGLEGILTVDDVLELLAEELSLLSKVAAHGQEQEKQKRT